MSTNQPPAPEPDEAPCHCWYDGPPCPRHPETPEMRGAVRASMEARYPAPSATTGPADEAEGLAEFRLPPSRRGRFENVRKAGIQHYNERPDDSTTPAGGGVPSSASRAVEHQAATVSPAGPNLAELIHLTPDWLATRDAAQQRIGAEKALREAVDEIERRFSVNLANHPHVATFYNGGLQDALGVLRDRADRIAREGRA